MSPLDSSSNGHDLSLSLQREVLPLIEIHRSQEHIALEREVRESIGLARPFLGINSAEEKEGAFEYLQRNKILQNKVAMFFEKAKKLSHFLHTTICDMENDLNKSCLVAVARSINAHILAYNEQEQRKADELARKINAENAARAERERKALLAKAERMKTEAKREEYIERAESVVAPVAIVESAAPRLAGESTRKTWKARLFDKRALILAAAQGNETAASLLIFDQAAANTFARAVSGKVYIPGVEYYTEKSLAVKSHTSRVQPDENFPERYFDQEGEQNGNENSGQ